MNMLDPATRLLSRRLRLATSALHHQAEVVLDLPAAISDQASYADILNRFHGVYMPLEQALRRQSGWRDLDLDLQERGHAQRLANDLAALNTGICDRGLPDFRWLTSFPHALGALYVQEGSTLGGQIILRHLQARATGVSANAMSFFGGYGSDTRARWQALVAALDAFGEAHPEAQDAVQVGAEQTFLAVIAAFSARHPRSGSMATPSVVVCRA